MNEILNFLTELSRNNNREWFNAHKDLYLKAKQQFDALVESLIDEVRNFDPEVGPLTVADCTWRIYRDTRFSHDKRPYKTNMGCYFAPQGGKRGPFSGYYFQVGISDEDGSIEGMVAAGNYYTESPVLKILREDIAFDEAETFEEALAEAKGFYLDKEQMLKRVPLGFESDKSYSQYFLYKNFCLVKVVGEKYILADNLKQKLIADFKVTKPFLHFINRAIRYSIENPT